LPHPVEVPTTHALCRTKKTLTLAVYFRRLCNARSYNWPTAFYESQLAKHTRQSILVGPYCKQTTVFIVCCNCQI